MKPWFKHIEENKTSYGSHMAFALKCGLQCFVAGVCLVVHAFLPNIFEKNGSKIIKDLNSGFKH